MTVGYHVLGLDKSMTERSCRSENRRGKAKKKRLKVMLTERCRKKRKIKKEKESELGNQSSRQMQNEELNGGYSLRRNKSEKKSKTVYKVIFNKTAPENEFKKVSSKFAAYKSEEAKKGDEGEEEIEEEGEIKLTAREITLKDGDKELRESFDTETKRTTMPKQRSTSKDSVDADIQLDYRSKYNSKKNMPELYQAANYSNYPGLQEFSNSKSQKL
jgi:hypothetical protein